MKNSTILHEVTPEQIDSKFERLETKLNELKSSFEPKSAPEYITRQELANQLKCDLSTIHNWTKKGKLKAYGIGNRVYYKRSEVEAILTPLFSKDQGEE